MKELKRLREIRNLSQQALAEAVGVTQVAISKFESGKKTPRVKTLKKLAKELNCSTDHLLYGKRDSIFKEGDEHEQNS